MSFMEIKELLKLVNFFETANVVNEVLVQNHNFSLSVELPNEFFYEDAATGNGTMGLTEGTTFCNQGISLASNEEIQNACSVVVQNLSEFEHLFARRIQKIRLYENDCQIASWETFV